MFARFTQSELRLSDMSLMLVGVAAIVHHNIHTSSVATTNSPPRNRAALSLRGLARYLLLDTSLSFCKIKGVPGNTLECHIKIPLVQYKSPGLLSSNTTTR
ncbi:hypothetical protein EVAR_11321_1 [Eumeta japonica]|uniref:Uncharacterized protein n=1 Tax=Eumeta variegata TaxID=151549 RepID=A0A4C1U0R8_EUMVA|nr:hypothetical protein EVAR_11321_1 [Eumeta japonica]